MKEVSLPLRNVDLCKQFAFVCPMYKENFCEYTPPDINTYLYGDVLMSTF